MAKAGDVRIEFVGKDGKVEVKKQLSLQEGEVLDNMFMSCGSHATSSRKTLQDCKETGVVGPARQGDHDEDFPPDRLRTCGGERLLQGRLRQVGPTLPKSSA